MKRFNGLVRDGYRVAKVIFMFWIYVALLTIGSAFMLVASGVKQVLTGLGRIVGWNRSRSPNRS